MCRALELDSYAQGQGHNPVRGQIVSKIVLLINYWTKFDETSQKDKTLSEGVSSTWFRFLRRRSRSQLGQRSKSCLSNNSKTTIENLTKLYRKIEHNEKVCRALELDSYAQGQGHNPVRGQIVSKIVLLINYWSKFDKTSQQVGWLVDLYAPEGTSGGIFKSHRPSVRLSVRPSVTNRVSAISHKLLTQIWWNFTER